MLDDTHKKAEDLINFCLSYLQAQGVVLTSSVEAQEGPGTRMRDLGHSQP